MAREQQDKLWNNLSGEQKKEYREWYKESNSIEPLSEFDKGKLYGAELIFGSHNLNPKPLTYEDVAKELFGKNNEKQYGVFCCPVFSEVHCDKISAINALINVAKHLNGDWKPDWENEYEIKWSITIDNGKLYPRYFLYSNHCTVYFRTEELALQAIQILGEETIRLAFSTDY